MLSRALSKYGVYLFLALLAALVIAGAYVGGIYFGGSEVERKQAVEQLERNDELRKIDERIERNAPDGTDKSAAIEWLRQHTRPQ